VSATHRTLPDASSVASARANTPTLAATPHVLGREQRMTGPLPAATLVSTVALSARRSPYFYVNARDELGAAYRILSALAERGVKLLAFTAVPSGVDRAQFAIFPEDPSRLVAEARLAQIELEGPHHAFLVQGDDELGGLARVHERLFKAGVDVYASSGVSDGRGSFGYVVYVREDQFEQAAAALDL
jgi:hypothetical protein